MIAVNEGNVYVKALLFINKKVRYRRIVMPALQFCSSVNAIDRREWHFYAVAFVVAPPSIDWRQSSWPSCYRHECWDKSSSLPWLERIFCLVVLGPGTFCKNRLLNFLPSSNAPKLVEVALVLVQARLVLEWLVAVGNHLCWGLGFQWRVGLRHSWLWMMVDGWITCSLAWVPLILVLAGNCETRERREKVCLSHDFKKVRIWLR